MNEGLENLEDYVENVRVVDDVDALDADGNAVLQPLERHRRKRRSHVHDLAQRQPLHVQQNTAKKIIKSLKFSQMFVGFYLTPLIWNENYEKR